LIQNWFNEKAGEDQTTGGDVISNQTMAGKWSTATVILQIT
jgi:hypothetical protein